MNTEYETKVILLSFRIAAEWSARTDRVVCLSAQNFALKTNLLYDATATVNAGMEFKIAPNGQWTFQVTSMPGWPQVTDPATIDPKWNTGWYSLKPDITSVIP